MGNDLSWPNGKYRLSLTAEQAIDLEPEEFAIHLLKVIQRRSEDDSCYRPQLDDLKNRITGLILDNWHDHHSRIQKQFHRAVCEAWAWLELQGLLIRERDADWDPWDKGQSRSGYRRLSRLAETYVHDVDIKRHAAARLLPLKRLHPKLRDGVWSAFIRGEYEVAVMVAMKRVEIAVRNASGFKDLEPKRLMVEAFRLADESKGIAAGPLTDPTMHTGEQEGRKSVFAGVMASYRNAYAHRDVCLDDPEEAIELLMFANHLLRIIDRRREARDAAAEATSGASA